MTVEEYISKKIQPFGIQLSEADISDMYDFGLIPEGEKQDYATREVKMFMLKIVRERIDTLPSSISEDDMSVSYGDRMHAFYDSLCRELGVDNVFSKKSKIIFL